MIQMKDRVTFNENSIIITYANYGNDGRNYGELFDFLGYFDIITASELGRDVILLDSEVYFFRDQDECKLRRDGVIELFNECLLEDYIEKDNPEHSAFLQWYY